MSHKQPAYKAVTFKEPLSVSSECTKAINTATRGNDSGQRDQQEPNSSSFTNNQVRYVSDVAEGEPENLPEVKQANDTG